MIGGLLGGPIGQEIKRAVSQRLPSCQRRVFQVIAYCLLRREVVRGHGGHINFIPSPTFSAPFFSRRRRNKGRRRWRRGGVGTRGLEGESTAAAEVVGSRIRKNIERESSDQTVLIREEAEGGVGVCVCRGCAVSFWGVCVCV